MRRTPMPPALLVDPVSPHPFPEAQGPGQRVRVLGFLLAGIFGVSLVGVLVGVTPVSYAVTAGTLPLAALLTGAILWIRGRYVELDCLADRLSTGGLWGALALVPYDLFRVLARWVSGGTYELFQAMPAFGRLLTGLPSTNLAAIGVGWSFHLWVGAVEGMIFALLRPRGGVAAGIVFAMVIQITRLFVYPDLIPAAIRVSGPLPGGIVGFGIWGAVLGAGCQRRGGDRG